jgi:hypothetical protein
MHVLIVMDMCMFVFVRLLREASLRGDLSICEIYLAFMPSIFFSCTLPYSSWLIIQSPSYPPSRSSRQ